MPRVCASQGALEPSTSTREGSGRQRNIKSSRCGIHEINCDCVYEFFDETTLILALFHFACAEPQQMISGQNKTGIVSRHERSQGLLYQHLCHSLIHQVILSLPRLYKAATPTGLEIALQVIKKTMSHRLGTLLILKDIKIA